MVTATFTDEEYERISAALLKSSQTLTECSQQMALADRYAAALRAIIDRADNGTLGSSKVQDMRKLAEETLR